MVATGTGLAPFMSMIPTLFERGFPRHITLLFGVRHPEDLFYQEQLEQWQKDHPNFHAQLTLSQAPEAWTGLRGRVTDHLEAFGTPDVLNTLAVYICGNGEMVKAVKDYFDAQGLPKTALHLEQFTALKA